jgi:hypothetical protein
METEIQSNPADPDVETEVQSLDPRAAPSQAECSEGRSPSGGGRKTNAARGPGSRGRGYCGDDELASVLKGANLLHVVEELDPNLTLTDYLEVLASEDGRVGLLAKLKSRGVGLKERQTLTNALSRERRRRGR